jgi:glycolate oxidase FAD binding subunit
VQNFGPSGAGVLYRITVPTRSVAEVMAQVEGWSGSGEGPRAVAHVGAGTVYLSLDNDISSMEWLPKLADLAKKHQGHVVVVDAPAELKHGIDVWGPPPPSLDLMREIKRRFDPRGILNPGRFLASL